MRRSPIRSTALALAAVVTWAGTAAWSAPAPAPAPLHARSTARC